MRLHAISLFALLSMTFGCKEGCQMAAGSLNDGSGVTPTRRDAGVSGDAGASGDAGSPEGDYALGEAHAFSPVFFGYNGNLAATNISWANPYFIAGVASLSPGNIRYPGGTVASYWDWRTSTIATSADAILRANFRNPMPLAEYALNIQETGAEAVLVVNMLTSTLAEQLAFLREARDLGIAVRRVELGNEYFFPGRANDYITKFPTAEDYARAVTVWTNAIRAEFPGVSVAAVGTSVTPADSVGERRRTWNDRMLRATNAPDAYTVHHYVKVNETTRHADLPALARRDLDGLRDEFALFERAGKRVWLTEFNFEDPIGAAVQGGTWSHAMLVATLVSGFLAEPAIELIDLHNLSGNVRYAGLFWSTSAFGTGGPRTPGYGRTASGFVLSRFAELAEGASQVRPIEVSEAVSGAVFESRSRRTLVLVNGGGARRIDLSGLVGEGSEVEIWSAAMDAKIITDSDITKTRRVVSGGLLDAPAMSVFFVTL